MDTNKTVLTEQQRTEIFERHFSHDHPNGADIGRDRGYRARSPRQAGPVCRQRGRSGEAAQRLRRRM